MARTTNRRAFLASGAVLTGSALLSASPWSTLPMPGKDPKAKEMKISEVIDMLIEACGGPLPSTVDTVKAGDADQLCTGIGSTFLSTANAIRRCADAGANLLITHEPTYYNHLDETEWLTEDPVYQLKKKRLDETGMVVWRFHDYWHRHRPDGILEGFLRKVDWSEKQHPERPNVVTLTASPLQDVAAYLKRKLGTERAFITGDPRQSCRNVALVLGASGRDRHLAALRQQDIDAVVIGEGNEWETCEWVRDANELGLKKGLIVVGHQASEEPGMAYLAEWLKPRVPGIPVTHISAHDPFTLV